METSRALSFARAYRAQIERHIVDAVAELDQPPETACMSLARRRWALVKMLKEYHLFKQVEIFGPATLSGNAEQAADAVLLQQLCDTGLQSFCDYALDWSKRDVVTSWDRYSAAMTGMARGLCRHLASEEAAIERLLTHSSRTRRLAQAKGIGESARDQAGIASTPAGSMVATPFSAWRKSDNA